MVRTKIVLDRRGQAIPRLATMLLRATIPPRPAVDAEESCCVDPDCQWNEETTGSVLELDATQFAEKLRTLLDRELRNARHSEGGDKTEQVSRTPRFLNQATLTHWLDQQSDGGKKIVELAAFPCVVEYPDHWNELIFMNPWGLSDGRWSTFL